MSKCSCCIVSGFDDTSSFGVPGGAYHDDKVYKSKIIKKFWSDRYRYHIDNNHKYNNYDGLWKTVALLVSGHHQNISVRIKLAENLIKASRING